MPPKRIFTGLLAIAAVAASLVSLAAMIGFIRPDTRLFLINLFMATFCYIPVDLSLRRVFTIEPLGKLQAEEVGTVKIARQIVWSLSALFSLALPGFRAATSVNFDSKEFQYDFISWLCFFFSFTASLFYIYGKQAALPAWWIKLRERGW